jgi:NitT/TauT family transport system ATP-binding protein
VTSEAPTDSPGSPAPPPVIQAEGVTKRFDLDNGPLTALEDVSFAVSPGEFVTIIGPSGCGKSTLLRLVADIYQPTTGTILVDGMSPGDARRRREMGVVFQDPSLFPWRDVVGNIALPLEIAGRSARDRDGSTIVGELVRLVGLDGFEHARPAQLSGGMRQRALLITHSLSEAVFLSDRVLVMTPRPGRICAEVPIDLPRPRPSDVQRTTAFFDLVNRVSDALFGGAASAEEAG